MNRTDGAYEKVIHVKTILSTSLPKIRNDPLRRAVPYRVHMNAGVS